ncbi:ankyrin repeat-containing protein [Hibiscus syriacus]|uniref:Ankyrin repeat-containing protein n=1 Tax=Hibiscus syriacus TaxID=106335 RepID=A0A6A2Y304_HIBSY|nr:ankyrin repeat-containing protein [Hibiscus syriacus]
MKASMRDNPSFSSTLLEKIYRSIDDGETKTEDLEGYSTSISSDSSSGEVSFSSSDTESMYCTKTKAPSCFVRPWPKLVKTRVSATAAQPDKILKTEKRAAEKIYCYSKKAKQRQPPVSPGGRLSSFINSLFTTGNTKKSRSSSSTPALSSTASVVSHDQKHHVSSCSSASSFSRSCLSKNSPSAREKLRDGAKRTVRFCPVNVIVDEDSRPCGQRETGKPPSRKHGQEIKFQTMEREQGELKRWQESF